MYVLTIRAFFVFQGKDNRAQEIMGGKFMDEEELEMYYKDISKTKIQHKFCEECSIIRRKQVFHCKSCGVCIEGQNYHCFAMGICIGKNNIPAFISFLFLGLITSIFSIVVSGTEDLRYFYNAQFD